MMLYLEVDGNRDDPRDVYINGVAELHLKGLQFSMFVEKEIVEGNKL